MTAALLRDAATLLRARAQAATPGPWCAFGPGARYGAVSAPDDPDPDEGYGGKLIGESVTLANRAHLATFGPPAVALALADWLQAEVDTYSDESTRHSHYAVAVARAYLGRES